jgi:hypothetical protein
MSWTNHIDSVIQGATGLISAGLAATAATWFYFRQKEYELVQRRYLEEGVDVLLATAEAALNAYSLNWARGLMLIKAFREPSALKVQELSAGFLEMPTNPFALTANYRVSEIVGSSVIWQTYQLVLAFAQNSSTLIRDEVVGVIRMSMERDPRIDASREVIVSEAEQVMRDLNEKSHRYHVFLSQVQRIARLLERQRFQFSAIQKLRDHEEVRAAVQALRAEFATELAEDDQNESQGVDQSTAPNADQRSKRGR